MPHTRDHRDDVHLYYELHGPPHRPVLVLNNGILMTTASWPLQMPAFVPAFRVLLYDCRGQGRSDHPAGPYTMATHADDLAWLLDLLGIDDAHIAGISYGGEVAQAFALAWPDRVRSLVLADTVSEVDAPLRQVVEEWRDVALAGDAGRFFEVTVPWNFSPSFIEANPALIRDARRRYEQLDLQSVARLCDAFLSSVDFTARLREIHAPTCLIVGAEDRLKGLTYAQRIHRAVARSELHVIPGAGHASCWERPAEFNRAVLAFLQDQDSSSAANPSGPPGQT